MRALRSLAFYLAFYLGSTAVVMRAAIALVLNDEPTFRRKVDDWARWHRFCLTHILGIRVEIIGAFPPGPVLVALKHESFMEAIELPLLLPNPAVFVKRELMRIPLWGLAARKYGLVEVARDQGARALRHMLTSARALQAEGRSFMIFPEGTRVPHGERPPLQSGFVGLYKLLGLPVVPVAVESGPVYHRFFKARGTIRLLIGAPIEPGLAREEIEGRVHAEINRLNPAPAE
jgi:1-acyl-sn-glycerol-3-phosphate acyltransferase